MFRENKSLITLLIISIFILMSTTNACAYVSYQVKSGDSLFKLSRKFNTSISTLSSLNKINNPNLIYTKQTLKLPESNPSSATNYSRAEKKYSGSSTNISSFSNSKTTANYNSITWQDNNITTAREKSLTEKKQIYRKNPKVKQIALTFDDGPDTKYTPQILKVLKEYNVKATFFLIGKLSVQNREVVAQIVRDGHTIGNHTWSHANLTKLTKGELDQELNETTRIIKEITNRKPKLLRPPYGFVSNELLEKLQETNYEIIHWSIDSLDWKANSKEEVLEKVLPKIHNGAIILFHSAGGPTQDLTPTVKALPVIIEKLRAENIKLVTVDELLSLPAYG